MANRAWDNRVLSYSKFITTCMSSLMTTFFYPIKTCGLLILGPLVGFAFILLLPIAGTIIFAGLLGTLIFNKIFKLNFKENR